MWSSASSRSSTTRIATSRLRYSVAQSSSVAGTTPAPRRTTAGVAVHGHARVAAARETTAGTRRGAASGARARSRPSCTRSVAAPWRSRRCRAPTPAVRTRRGRCARLRRRSRSPARRFGHDGLDELGAAPRNEDVDDAAGVHELARALAAEVVDGLDRLGVDARGPRAPRASRGPARRWCDSAAEPPRSTTALPERSASAAMSTVTFGRAS